MKAPDRLGYVLQLGMMPFATALDLQRQLAAARAEERIPDVLLLLEHPHTYTLGRSGQIEHLLMSESDRERKGISVFEVDRGGDITYHGPGQLVGYPVVYVGVPGAYGRLHQVDYLAYLRRIENVLIACLAEWGISGIQLRGSTGVWVQSEEPAKIAAIGVKVDGRGVSQHGFALNVTTDLSFFEGIVPCGIHDRGVTSMDRFLGRQVDLVTVRARVVAHFGRLFNLDLVPVSLECVQECL